ncbi:hypothetical protein CQW23_34187 [Capsicum baccatum]|uniref:Uncharacterized protein n=1 Tax=Capsicum baccatum TaxID=33114 RepID=A0A2G2UZU6_CAPBA|nr:hypothetical protein CQW23_34187 [Capsicum baccatum]
MPKSDERFARQYRCGPPPEFPLASPRSGIGHHLSGPDRYAHTRTLLKRSRSVGGAPLGGIPPISFLMPYGFTRPLTRTHVRLLGPCFKTGRMGSPQASIRSAQMPKHAGGARCLPQSRRRHSTSVSRARALAVPPIHAGPHPESIGVPARRRSTYDRGAPPAPIRFPPDNFKHSLTLSFKVLFFFPSRQSLVVRQDPVTTGLSPSPAPPSRGLGPGPPLRTLLQTTIRTTGPPDSKAGLFPIGSPLLRERQRAESQWIVAARPLCHLQYPVAYLSCLQRILPATRWKLYFKAAAAALRTTAKAFAKDVFINQERKLGARRRSDTVRVSTINDADQGSADVAFRPPPAPYEKSKFLGSEGSMVARLKLKGIDGRAPPGVEPAA